MRELTPKQEKFCQEYIKLGCKSEAYKASYSTSNMKKSTINRRAVTVADLPHVRARIEQLQSELREESDIDRDYILKEYKDLLESCKEEGLDGKGTIKDRTNWAKALSQLTKMLGLDEPDRVVHDVTQVNVNVRRNRDDK